MSVAGGTLVTLASKLAEVMLTRVSKRAKKADVLRATLIEVAEQLTMLEARVARLENFTKLLDMDQDDIPDYVESIVKARTKVRSGLQLK